MSQSIEFSENNGYDERSNSGDESDNGGTLRGSRPISRFPSFERNGSDIEMYSIRRAIEESLIQGSQNFYGSGISNISSNRTVGRDRLEINSSFRNESNSEGSNEDRDSSGESGSEEEGRRRLVRTKNFSNLNTDYFNNPSTQSTLVFEFDDAENEDSAIRISRDQGYNRTLSNRSSLKAIVDENFTGPHSLAESFDMCDKEDDYEDGEGYIVINEPISCENGGVMNRSRTVRHGLTNSIASRASLNGYVIIDSHDFENYAESSGNPGYGNHPHINIP
ncbi:hypothetical protein AYI68_g7495 [Smittium mucronatum]|uniref:Uncharacterized protein n=1 Tax=Smittium mucronatum TaxID=133383 RepID=A0A1R0GNK0_9FUNG|nr:hypothetical protein AYI68_g7495 [Smittium mucronatum]